MKTQYTNANLHFSLEGVAAYAPNIVFERFMRDIPAHSHGEGCYEIHYIPAGRGRLQADGRCYDLLPNTLFVTGPHVVHAQSPLPADPMQEYCVYLRFPSPEKGKKASLLLAAFLSTRFWIGQEMQGLHRLMKQLFDELERRDTGYEAQVQLLLAQMVILLVRNYGRERHPQYRLLGEDSYHSKPMVIEEYFLYEYRTLSLDALARRLRLSTRQTQRLLQDYYGKTFQQKKEEARMSVAALLLGDKGRSIASIAEALGYSSPEHFSAAFKRYYRMSPSRYREEASASPLGDIE